VWWGKGEGRRVNWGGGTARAGQKRSEERERGLRVSITASWVLMKDVLCGRRRWSMRSGAP